MLLEFKSTLKGFTLFCLCVFLKRDQYLHMRLIQRVSILLWDKCSQWFFGRMNERESIGDVREYKAGCHVYHDHVTGGM